MDINESRTIMETKNACTKHQMKMINKLGFDTYRDKRTGYVVSKEGDFYLTMDIDQCIDWIRTQFDVVIYHKIEPFVNPKNPKEILYKFGVKYCNRRDGWNGRVYVGESNLSSNVYSAKRTAITKALRWLLKRKSIKLASV